MVHHGLGGVLVVGVSWVAGLVGSRPSPMELQHQISLGLTLWPVCGPTLLVVTSDTADFGSEPEVYKVQYQSKV